ncbi:hypothetical protein MNEG_6348 [Monoraphidium neglectum]|jgi:hypothetical protein|uniref:Uncharacterized protein n=1 Tax=Monoraphidium neglectum TaxID=145388 RepID=A0A0D2MM52_9CHLO|nr:hypothetical protein MNEG_6348 [Monoraphidium neglectum]KIZ01612.1 hypothetical protein MNEG_6348 [Monoraphidium neglectum]|eukprot:XP_013900631.1 hypothetical protein MNEG_6348 [Monoraphidium neglectum]
MNQQSKVSFVQMTLKIASRQRFAAYYSRGGAGGAGAGANSRGALASGDPDEVLDVVDHWVLERKVFDDKGAKDKIDPPGARWRVVARLQV